MWLTKLLGFSRIPVFQGSMIVLFWAYVLSFILRLLRAAHRRVGILPYVFSWRSWQLCLWISVIYDIRMSQNARILWASSNTGILCLFSLWLAFLWLFPIVFFSVFEGSTWMYSELILALFGVYLLGTTFKIHSFGIWLFGRKFLEHPW